MKRLAVENLDKVTFELSNLDIGEITVQYKDIMIKNKYLSRY